MTSTPQMDEATSQLKSLFREIPGTRLSLADASRLAGVDPSISMLALEALVASRFLARAGNGLFVYRSADSPLA